jgi:hypothetical protein
MSVELETETIRFSAENEATLIRVGNGVRASEIIEKLGIPLPHAVVSLNGGTEKLEGSLAADLESILVDGFARIASEEALTVVTGGTDAGIFSIFGKGVEKWGKPAAVIGVVPEKLVKWPGGGAGDTPLEPHHSHFILVEGGKWGDETRTMYSLIKSWEGVPSLGVFAGGGEVTLCEMKANIDQRRKMVLLAGSGRSADAVITSRVAGTSADTCIQEIAFEGDVVPFDVRGGARSFAELIRKLLLK